MEETRSLIALKARFNSLKAPLGRGATFIVAGNNAPPHVLEEADYKCRNSADDVTINEAITALPPGRAVKYTVKLVGTFTLSNYISLASYTTLDLTEAKITQANGANKDLIYGTGLTDIAIIGGWLDGNKSNQTAQTGTNNGIRLHNCQRVSLLGEITVKSCCLEGVYLSECSDVKIGIINAIENYGNGVNFGTCHDVQGVAIYAWDNGTTYSIGADTAGRFGVIVYDTYAFQFGQFYLKGNGKASHGLGDGAYLASSTYGATHDITIGTVLTKSNNNDGMSIGGLGVNSDVIGVTIGTYISFQNAASGLYMNRAHAVSISSVLTRTNGYAGVVADDYCTDVTMGSVVSFNNNQSSHGTFRSGIYISDSSTIIVGIARCYDTQTPKTQVYGIEEEGASDNNLIIACNVSDNLTAGMVIVGANTRVNDNIGYSSTKWSVFDASLAVQQSHIIDADGTLADITTKFNTLLGYLETYGLLKTS